MIGFASLLSLALLLSISISVTFAILQASPGLQDYALYTLSVTGLLLGWLLALRRKPSIPLTFAIIAFGFVLIFIHIGKLYRPISESSLLALQTGIQEIFRQADWTPIAHSVQTVLTDAGVVLLRLELWIGSLVGGNPQYDPWVNAFIWSIPLWLSSFWAGWCVHKRKNVLLSLLPAIGMEAISLNYVRGHPFPLLITLLAAFLLMVLVQYTKRESGWTERGIDFSEEIRIDQAFSGAALSMSLILLAVLIPSINIRYAINTIDRFSQAQFERFESLGRSLGLNSGINPELQKAGTAASSLPRRHLLGSGPELSQQQVMTVKVIDIGETGPDGGSVDTKRAYYWRSRTYDIYNGSGWTTSDTVINSYQKGEPIQAVIPKYDHIVTQQVQRLNQATNLLYFTGSLLSVDSLSQIAWRKPSPDNPPADQFAGTVSSQVYQAQSSVPYVSRSLLIGSGTAYPDWVQERYLTLPQRIPPRVIQLANELADGKDTPFARAEAIEQYLRTIPYSLDIPAPPANRDAVDYFLFDLQKGYCDYYASAMVVLARAVNLPARLVIGYTGGSYDPQNDLFLVTEANAHSWPEIYFPTIGWVEFEPTAAFPATEWLATGSPIVDRGEVYQSPWNIGLTSNQKAKLFSRWLGIAAPALVLAAGIALLGSVLILDTLRLRSSTTNSALLQLYDRLRRQAYKMGIPIPSSQTPHELAADLNNYFERIGHGSRLERIFVASPPKVDALIDLYLKSVYSQSQPEKSDQQRAIEIWSDLRYRMWIARLIKSVSAAFHYTKY